MADKKPKEKNVMEIAREMEQQQQEIAAQQQELLRRKKEEERLAYEEQLRQDRLELIRLKQGVIEESETIHEEVPEERHYTFREKVSNFFYHNKWWMGIASCLVLLVGILTWQMLTTVRPDMIILLLSDDDIFYSSTYEAIDALFEQYIQDENGDGKVKVDVYYIPASQDTADRSGFTGESEKLFSEFQMGEAVMVISDEGADAFIVPEHTLTDLSEEFGDYQETDGFRFLLSDTDFAKAVGWEEPLDKDIYIGLRQVRKTLDSEEKMQTVYDIAHAALKQFIADYGHQK